MAQDSISNKALTEDNSKKKKLSTLIGAAFIMATSCIGPGFLTQTASFTGQFQASFGFVILVTVFFAICTQLNIWRVVCVSGLRGQDVANRVLPGLGHFLAGIIVLGGLVFNIGNVGGTGLGLMTILNINPIVSYVLCGAIGVAVFLFKNAQNAIDKLVKGLGVIIILLGTVIIFVVKPPFALAAKETIMPSTDINLMLPAMLTILGGTVGGYIPFSGAHRLIDAKIVGEQNLPNIKQSAVMGISITGLVRVLIFLAVLGVVVQGNVLDAANPAADAFRIGAGQIGYFFFGIVLWAAGMSSIVGCAYTSISFLKTLSKFVNKHESAFTVGFIILSTAIMCVAGKSPASLLLLVGALNGLVLPITLGVCLLASRRKDIMGEGYRHPPELFAVGVVVALMAAYMGVNSLSSLATLFNG